MKEGEPPRAREVIPRGISLTNTEILSPPCFLPVHAPARIQTRKEGKSNLKKCIGVGLMGLKRISLARDISTAEQ